MAKRKTRRRFSDEFKAEANGQAIDEDERTELRRLRKENAELRMERESLQEPPDGAPGGQVDLNGVTSGGEKGA